MATSPNTNITIVNSPGWPFIYAEPSCYFGAAEQERQPYVSVQTHYAAVTWQREQTTYSNLAHHHLLGPVVAIPPHVSNPVAYRVSAANWNFTRIQENYDSYSSFQPIVYPPQAPASAARPWTEQGNYLLVKAVNSGIPWDTISVVYLGGTKTPQQCEEQYNKIKNQNITPFPIPLAVEPKPLIVNLDVKPEPQPEKVAAAPKPDTEKAANGRDRVSIRFSKRLYQTGPLGRIDCKRLVKLVDDDPENFDWKEAEVIFNKSAQSLKKEYERELNRLPPKPHLSYRKKQKLRLADWQWVSVTIYKNTLSEEQCKQRYVVPKPEWHPYEDTWLKNVIVSSVEIKNVDWYAIAKTAFPHIPGRNYVACKKRFTEWMKPLEHGTNLWTDHELKTLLAAVKEHGSNWPLICLKYFPAERTAYACQRLIMKMIGKDVDEGEEELSSEGEIRNKEEDAKLLCAFIDKVKSGESL